MVPYGPHRHATKIELAYGSNLFVQNLGKGASSMGKIVKYLHMNDKDAIGEIAYGVSA
jgi:hypothetical protein